MDWYRPLLLATLLLAGCGTLPGTVSPVSDDQQWRIKGKLGLWGQDVKESANLDWQQCQSQLNIRLSGPLGSNAAVITGDGQQITLERSGEPPLSADSPEQLAGTLGWPLPVSALQYWILGRPVPLEAFRGRHDANGQLTDLRQLGWDIRFSTFREVEGRRLPSRIELSDDQWRIKAIIRDWLFKPEACGRP